MKKDKDFSIIAPVCYIISAVLLFYALFSLVALIIPPPPPPPLPPPTPTPTPPPTTTTIATKPPRSDTEENQKDTILTSCGTPCKASPKEIKEATIRKVEYRPQPGTGLNELHLDVETADQQNFIIHVSPEYKISRCPDLFRFHEGEIVTVVGFELLENQSSICATEVTRQNAETLRLRDQTTGTYNNELFNHEICRKELPPPSIYSCGKSWKTPLIEIEGTIRKVENRRPPWGYGNQKGLHLDVETADRQDIVVHVFPEPKTSQCPDLFSFHEGETVTVVGSEFSTPKKQGNICAAEIIRQNSEVPDLKVRDPITGKHNNTVFNNKTCINKDELKRSSFFSWTKSFLTYLKQCEHCIDKLEMWKDPEGILSSCKDCARYVSIIPKEFLQLDYVALCQKACSNCSANKMPTIFLTTCMNTCGANTGLAVGMRIKSAEINDDSIKKDFPHTWKFRQRQKARRAYLFLLSFLL